MHRSRLEMRDRQFDSANHVPSNMRRWSSLESRNTPGLNLLMLAQPVIESVRRSSRLSVNRHLPVRKQTIGEAITIRTPSELDKKFLFALPPVSVARRLHR